MFLIYRVLIILFVFLLGGLGVQAQEIVAPADSLAQTDSLLVAPTDSTTLAGDSIPEKQTGLDAPVSYQATDSIVMTAGNWAYLYGEGDVKYQNIELQSELIEMNMDSSIVFAKFGLDSIGQEFGYPLFKEGDQQYESKTMRYNFGTKKGYITDVITQQGEGYVTAGRTKKMEGDILNMVGGKYTTCDEHEHPHFYIQMTKAKVRPKKNIVTGPVYLVLEDVPLYPIGLPFCFFPFSSTYSSGIIMPTFGDESTRGFFLRDGGYYFALSDYMDLALLGEIYTKGSWGLSAKSAYRKRYKFSGSFNASYLVTKLGDKGLPDYSLSKDFKVNWTHTQDPKANPYLSFSASVNFSTSSYDRNNQNSLYPNASGYADAHAFHPRAAYSWCAELSIYLSNDCHGMGIGRELYGIMENILKKQNILNLYSCVAYTEIEDEYLTQASVHFHEHLGFKICAHLHNCGYKFNRWYDMVYMEKNIGEHITDMPAVIPFNELDI